MEDIKTLSRAEQYALVIEKFERLIDGGDPDGELAKGLFLVKRAAARDAEIEAGSSS